MKAEDGRDLEHIGEEIGNDIERIVKVDGEEVFVTFELTGPQSISIPPPPLVANEYPRVRFGLRLLVRSTGESSEEGRAFVASVVADERFVSFVNLSTIRSLRPFGALSSVIAGEGSEDLEDAMSLIEGGRELSRMARSADAI